MPKKRTSLTDGDKVFVRGADGSLYILTKDKPPYKLKAQEAQKVEAIFNDAGKLVKDRLKDEVSQFGSMVNIPFPRIFP